LTVAGGDGGNRHDYEDAAAIAGIYSSSFVAFIGAHTHAHPSVRIPITRVISLDLLFVPNLSIVPDPH
jgi:hypothetical protein